MGIKIKLLSGLILLTSFLEIKAANDQFADSVINAAPANDSLKVIYYLEIANQLQNTEPEQTEYFLNIVVNLLKDSESIFGLASLATCYNLKGIVSTILGNYPNALENYQSALYAYEVLHEKDKNHLDYHEGKANILANIGSIYYHKKNHDKAIEYWEKAIEAIRQLNLPESEALLLSNIGIIYFEMNKPEKALEFYNQALDIFISLQNDKEISMCYTNIGEVYGELGYYSKALELFEKSKNIKTKINDKYGLLQCLLSMSRLCIQMNENLKAVEYAHQTLQLSKQLEAVREILRSYELLSEANANLGNFKIAYEMQVIFKHINDSIFNEESRARFNEIQSRYENVAKENELKLSKQNEQNQRTLKKILVAGIIIIFIFSTSLIANLLAKKRKEKSIFLKDKQLMEQEKQLVSFELEKKELLTGELNQEIEYKTRQLTTHALNIMQKNKMLYEMLKSIDAAIKTAGTETKEELRQLKAQVKRNLKTDKDWDVFKLYFEQINKGFFESLLKITPDLNIHDLRHCALIRLNLNIKETASVLNLSPNSIKSARYRLKKKLQLEPDDDLFDFLRKL